MVRQSGSFGEVAFPALLRAAWKTYASKTQQALADAGFDDVPRNGSYVIGAIRGAARPSARSSNSLGCRNRPPGILSTPW